MNKLKDKRTKEEILKVLDKAMQQEDQMGDRIKQLESDLSDCRKKMDDPRSELVEKALPASKISFRIDYYRTTEKGSIKGIIEHLSSRQKKNFESEHFEVVTDFMAKYLPKKKIKATFSPIKTVEEEEDSKISTPAIVAVTPLTSLESPVEESIIVSEESLLKSDLALWPTEEPLESNLLEATPTIITVVADISHSETITVAETPLNIGLEVTNIEIIEPQPRILEENPIPAAAKRAETVLPEGLRKSKITSALERSKDMIENPTPVSPPKSVPVPPTELESDFDEMAFDVPAHFRHLLSTSNPHHQTNTPTVAIQPVVVRGKIFEMAGNPVSEVLVSMKGMEAFKNQSCIATLSFENMENGHIQTQKTKCMPNGSQFSIAIAPTILLSSGAYRVTTLIQTLHTDPKVMYRETRLFVSA